MATFHIKKNEWPAKFSKILAEIRDGDTVVFETDDQVAAARRLLQTIKKLGVQVVRCPINGEEVQSQ